MRVCAQSYCSVLCCVPLISLRGLFCSERNHGKNGSGVEGSSGGRENWVEEREEKLW